MGFQLSPGVVTSEIDLTTIVPAVSTSTGAYAGIFNWGPVGIPTQVSSEIDLVSKFGKPDFNTAMSFFTCSNFLAYGNDLRVVRAANTTSALSTNKTTSAVSGAVNTVVVNNSVDYFSNYYSSNNSTAGAFTARYPGSKGNSLQVTVCGSSSQFSSWTYNTSQPCSTLFSGAPGTSTYARNIAGGISANDEMHIVVIDQDGLFSGRPGTVLETFPYVSKASDAKDDTGTSIYYKDVLYTKSKYIYATDYPFGGANGYQTIGLPVASVMATTNNGGYYVPTSNYTSSLAGGQDGAPTSGEIYTAYQQFIDPENIDISLVLTGTNDPVTTSYLIAATRKDCIAFISPPQSQAQSASSIVSWRNTTISTIDSSYVVADSGWKYQYDKYNDVYRWVPLNGDIAGLCAACWSFSSCFAWFASVFLSGAAALSCLSFSWSPMRLFNCWSTCRS